VPRCPLARRPSPSPLVASRLHTVTIGACFTVAPRARLPWGGLECNAWPQPTSRRADAQASDRTGRQFVFTAPLRRNESGNVCASCAAGKLEHADTGAIAKVRTRAKRIAEIRETTFMGVLTYRTAPPWLLIGSTPGVNHSGIAATTRPSRFAAGCVATCCTSTLRPTAMWTAAAALTP
jgi:hypothetical protein